VGGGSGMGISRYSNSAKLFNCDIIATAWQSRNDKCLELGADHYVV